MTSRHCVRLKGADVVFTKMTPALVRILSSIDRFAQQFLIDVTVTSAYRKDSGAHGRGEALDVRVTDWPAWLIAAAHRFLRAELGPDFTVLYEVPVKPADPVLEKIAYISASATAPHFHVQGRRDLAGKWPLHEPL